MLCVIADGIEKDIQIGDFVQTTLFDSLAFQPHEILEVDESGLIVKIKYQEEEVVLNTSFISNVWRKI